jgi:hypothetical protein
MIEQEKITEDSIDEKVIKQLFRGERPEGMNYEDYRIKRKAIQLFLKRKQKGKFIYISKETVTETNPETGEKQLITKIYNPYKKQK